ncbi:hypothetical protein HPP92_024703 [Vanilla planifolia]|uniref:Uncharacterized protein n=1 Tax=Vanilla planifolia TaxID=51239 RepID=A0A835U8B8_VANPL|nr:hypothetical protein HPP92_024703 [Vanilla planifolia]
MVQVFISCGNCYGRQLGETGRPNPWRLSTVPDVEELKSILRILPLVVGQHFFNHRLPHNYTFAIVQAKSMDRHLFDSFHIPTATLNIFSVLPMLLIIVIYDRILVPLARRLTGLDSGITYFQRMVLGLSISSAPTS